ncbi:unnamed protein product [Linum trigynum]|uniref:Uncharacterized protein n=1 Tax=Linum trigynum TaxID=586398 RepID=A0AAV2E449_9ROSI
MVAVAAEPWSSYQSSRGEVVGGGRIFEGERASATDRGRWRASEGEAWGVEVRWRASENRGSTGLGVGGEEAWGEEGSGSK